MVKAVRRAVWDVGRLAAGWGRGGGEGGGERWAGKGSVKGAEKGVGSTHQGLFLRLAVI